MKTSLRPWRTDDGTSGTRLYLWCPACDNTHHIEVGPGGWDWDGTPVSGAPDGWELVDGHWTKEESK